MGCCSSFSDYLEHHLDVLILWQTLEETMYGGKGLIAHSFWSFSLLWKGGVQTEIVHMVSDKIKQKRISILTGFLNSHFMLSCPLANEMSPLLFKGGHSFQLFCSGDICAHFLDYFNSLRVTVQTKYLNFTPICTVSSWASCPLSPSLCVLLLDTYTYVFVCICYI